MAGLMTQHCFVSSAPPFTIDPQDDENARETTSLFSLRQMARVCCPRNRQNAWIPVLKNKIKTCLYSRPQKTLRD